MTNRPPSRLLEEIGWIAVRWARLESIIELSCAYLFKAGLLVAKDGKPPKAFNVRISSLRRTLRHSSFVHISEEFEAALDSIQELSRRRNDLMHGAFTKWEGELQGSQTVIRTHDLGHLAVLDIEVSLDDLMRLSDQIGRAFARQFNLHDRLAAIVRAYQGKTDIGRRGMMDE